MNRDTQRAKILALLTEARGDWVSLPEILELGIAQYGARIFELRRQGFNIENRTQTDEGTRHSWFRLVTSPTRQSPEAVESTPDWNSRPRATGLALFDAAVRK